MKALTAILWQYRLLILTATLSSLLGGILVIRTVPPVYEATARVVLEIAKPDPITGAVIGTKQLEAYVNSQAALIRDYQVAMRAVQNLGLTGDPELQAAYDMRPPTDMRSFPEWIAAQIVRSTTVTLLQDTNVLEISFRDDSPESATLIAEALRDAYVEAQVAVQRDATQQQLERLSTVTEAALDHLRVLESKKAQLERETGILITDTGRDLDSATLSQMANEEVRPNKGGSAPERPSARSPARELLRLDMTIASAAASLGPNNPQLQAMLQRRALLAREVERERTAAAAAGYAAVEMGTLISPHMHSQMSRIIDDRVEASRVRMAQDQVNQQRAKYDKLAQTGARLREMARLENGNVRPLEDTTIPTRPDFPRPELIIPGTMALGFIFSSLLALLIEFLNRRVRTPADLALAVPGALLVSVPKGRSMRAEAPVQPAPGSVLGPSPRLAAAE